MRKHPNTRVGIRNHRSPKDLLFFTKLGLIPRPPSPPSRNPFWLKGPSGRDQTKTLAVKLGLKASKGIKLYVGKSPSGTVELTPMLSPHKYQEQVRWLRAGKPLKDEKAPVKPWWAGPCSLQLFPQVTDRW